MEMQPIFQDLDLQDVMCRRVSEIQVLKHDNQTNTTQGKKLNDYFMQVAEVKLNGKSEKVIIELNYKAWKC